MFSRALVPGWRPFVNKVYFPTKMDHMENNPLYKVLTDTQRGLNKYLSIRCFPESKSFQMILSVPGRLQHTNHLNLSLFYSFFPFVINSSIPP